MKIKLDENLDHRLTDIFHTVDIQAETVLSEGLSGRSDTDIYEHCLREERVLITLDMDFSNPLRFPPEPTAGIIVLRPIRPVLSIVRSLLEKVMPILNAKSLKGKLWIIEPGRIRIFNPAEE